MRPGGQAAKSYPAARQAWIASISTDSRTIEKGDFFIPVKGDNFDGHDFIASAVSSGAAGIVYEKSKRDRAEARFKRLRSARGRKG